MTVRRLGAIALIFLGSTFAWSVLGSSLVARSGELDGRLSQEVAQLWGGAHRQVAPEAFVQRPVDETEIVDAKGPDGRVVRSEVHKTVLRPAPASLASTRASADLGLQYRQKGLLWFSTYDVRFEGRYEFVNPDTEVRDMHIRFPLPAADVMYDDFEFRADGRPLTLASDISKEALGIVRAQPGATVVVEIRYRSRGLGTWTYAFAPTGAAQVRDFVLTVTTNVADIDFPPGTMSPTGREARGTGTASTWTFSNLLTGQAIGVALPERLNPGPFAARVTFFAPLSLLFFLAVMVMLGVTRRRSLHPMHYWFVAAAFFAFHLLLAYLVDLIPVHAAFATAAAVSVFLVVSYLRVVTGTGRAIKEAGAAQVVFLVLFSYAFFFRGLTGLTITIGAIVTLFVLMQMTAHVSWDEVFQRGADAGPVDGGRDAVRR